ncbi:MAG: S41 family peptidase [Planctomycetota bacterium]|nr:S41 family peptidase [Planctomycetota bacterium]
MRTENRSFHLKSILFGAFWASVGILVTQHFIGPFLSRHSQATEEQILATVHRTISQDYVEPLSPEALMRNGARGMLESLRDPYVDFFGPDDLRSFQEGNSGVIVGIGVMLNSRGEILYPQPGGNAEAVGIVPGDRFVNIDGQSVINMDRGLMAGLLRGEAGSEVVLEMEHQDGTPFTATVKRSAVPTITVGDVRMLDMDSGIGHIHIRSFAKSTVAELDHALERLVRSGMKALILDLRWNPGGQLPSAINVAGRFLNGGLVCSLESRYAPTERRYAQQVDGKYFGMPLVLLVNGGSASGSEVVAAALRERGFALLVGARTYGKGIYQQVFEYDSGEFAMQFTAGYYVTPAGHILEGHLNPQLAGCLEPDLSVIADAEEDRLIRTWQRRNRPPAIYREAMEAAFPETADVSPPPDRFLDTAVAILNRSLKGS